VTIKRIAKLFAAQNANQLVLVLTQLLLPAAFVRVFGRAGYGEWIALTAAVGYLSTLNYGPQTYTNMQMTIHYNRGEYLECRHVQSAGLRILLSGFVLAAVLLLVVFFLPLQSMLRLTISNHEAHWTLYLMGVQVMSTMLLGFLTGSYMVFGEAHRGAHAANINQLTAMLAMVSLIYARQPFHIIALAQLFITLAMTLLVFVDLSRRKPDLRPTIRYWQPGALGSVLKPSSQYMLLASSNLIAYQVPALLMAHYLGPDLVGIFSLTRTIYSMSRRLLFLVTNSLQAEITLIYGQQDWSRLLRLYEFSERIILLMTPPITFGSMLATPLLMQIWLHRPHMFEPGTCIALGLTVSVLSIKEHKYQFQFSSNKVSEISWLTLVSYGAMSAISVPMMIHFGLPGFLVTWLVFEVGQFIYLLSLNDKLFAGHAVLDHRPVVQLFVVLAVCTAIFWWPMYHIAALSFLAQGAIATLATLVLSGICYRLFQVDELRSMLWEKLSGRFPALAARRS
jgi:O-antigen/teichoic acid export membrane protein